MKKRLLVLHLLREAGPRGVTTGEFLQAGAGSRYGGRVFELREQGHVIECERVREGVYRYTLTHDAERGVPSEHQHDQRIDVQGHHTRSGDVSLGVAAPPPAPQRDGQPTAETESPAPLSGSAEPSACPPPRLFDPPDRHLYRDPEDQAA